MANPKIVLATSDVASRALAPADAELFGTIIDAWTRRRIGSLRHTHKAVARDVSVLREFAAHSGLPPWLWNEDAFDCWCDHLGLERRLANSTQRHYQCSIRSFLEYLTTNVKFRNEIRRLYGVEPRQICTEENCIPHTVEKESSKERRAFTHEEIELFFDGLRRASVEAGRFRTKDYNPLRRDRTFFFTLYSGGLRISEGLNLNVNSFAPNPALPELGPYGFIKVWGKGSRGSGKRFRTVPVTHPDFPELMDWYITRVRPEFLHRADPNEEALFLSERGTRLKSSSADARFKIATRYCGLEGEGLTPHCLRHSSVTHESLRFSIEMVRRKHGHASAATTQGYMHVPDVMVDDEISSVVSRELDDALNTQEKKE
ncbi:tyrosine-type recombinase/integrase [Zoogloea sp. LCSB751]|uniref:tyrosine-type recombinase/integrase n=1 Tax=Zoogloea sp. LCSB751 TaxID=1965277 RepID=UPI0009A538B6|nr:tyrosine-type recombinase/integrase [Zoogloea sp. LCSB751]